MINFIFSNFNLIILSVWVIFFAIVVLRIVRPPLVKSVAYKYLIAGALSIHLLYGVATTWLTYIAWSMPLANGAVNETGKMLLSAALPKEAPLPIGALEFMRPLFSGAHGYFAGYAFFHYFLSTIALLIITGLFVLFFVMYKKEHPASFKAGDIEVITLAFLMAGYLGSIVLVPITLTLAVILVLIKLAMKKSNHISISAVFIAATPIAFIFATPLLSLVHLWPLLKL
ncbi:MAG: hypothetical protein WC791_02890 [Candidatus Paceibacterota bacterium]|jgi:hypothetical protein